MENVPKPPTISTAGFSPFAAAEAMTVSRVVRKVDVQLRSLSGGIASAWERAGCRGSGVTRCLLLIRQAHSAPTPGSWIGNRFLERQGPPSIRLEVL